MWDTEENPVLAEACDLQLPVGRMRKLAEDSDARVRVGIAQQPRCPSELLSVLVRDDDWLVRLTVATHAQCPEKDLRHLAGDTDPRVVWAATMNPNCPSDALLVGAGVLGEATYLKHPQCPSEFLTNAAQSPNPLHSEMVAAHPNTPAADLERLACDNPYWRGLVLGNPSCPEALLVAGGHPYKEHRQAVAGNPSTSLETLHALLNDDATAEAAAEAIALREWELLSIVPVPEVAEETPWQKTVTPYGDVVELLAWTMYREGYDGTLEELVAVVIGCL